MLVHRRDRRIAAAVASLVVLLGIILTFVLLRAYSRRPLYLRGAIIKQDDDSMKQSPITDVDIDVANDLGTPVKSNFSGYFSIRLAREVRRSQPVTLMFRHPDYQPLDVTEPAGDRLFVIKMAPIQKAAEVSPEQAPTPISNILIRYSTVSSSEENVGTQAKMFQVMNLGNVPCKKEVPCSPDKKWKAGIASESMDAGEGSEYRNARLTCIGGPCPFTRVDVDGFSHGGRQIRATVRDWSDTTTFLLQAEIFHPQINNILRTAYPVILGSSLNFTLPPSAEGPSIEAEVDDENVIFPLGPNPLLSWAECNVSVDKNKSKFFRCDLKSGYRFKESK